MTSTFLTSDLKNQLEWLSSNLHRLQIKNTIFMSYPNNRGHVGFLSERYHDWIQAYVGDHYLYIGKIEYFFNLSKTPSDDVWVNELSNYFLQKLISDGFWKKEKLSNCDIIILTAIYDPPIPENLYLNFSEVSAGIYLCPHSN
jgi:hypothetical protein